MPACAPEGADWTDLIRKHKHAHCAIVCVFVSALASHSNFNNGALIMSSNVFRCASFHRTHGWSCFVNIFPILQYSSSVHALCLVSMRGSVVLLSCLGHGVDGLGFGFPTHSFVRVQPQCRVSAIVAFAKVWFDFSLLLSH